MKLWKIAYTTFLRKSRDKQELLTSILLPLVLILILGSALQGNFTSQTLGNIPVGFYTEDEGPGRESFEEFLEHEEIREWLNIIPVSDYEEGVKMVNDLDLLALISLPPDFSERISQGLEAEIEVLDAGVSELYPSIVNSIVRSYVQGGNLYFAVGSGPGQWMGNGNPGEGTEGATEVQLIERNTFRGDNEPIRGIDYYAVTMLVMFVMWGIFSGSQSLTEDLFTPMKIRINTAPVSRLNYFIGKNFGVLGTFIVQILTIILFTKYAYGVNWGENILPIIGISLLLSFVAISLGLAVALISPSENASTSIINGFVVVATYIAGGFFPINHGEGILSLVRNFSPNYHAQRGIFHFLYGTEPGALTESILWLLGITLFAFVISLIFGRRRISEYL